MIVVLVKDKLGAVKLMLEPVATESVPRPLTILQFTASLKPPVPVITTVKAMFSAAFKVVFTALAVMLMTLEGGVRALMVKLTMPDLLGSCTLVARIIVMLELERLGAVKVIGEPVVAESEPAPLTMLHRTPVPGELIPVTVAVKLELAPASKVLDVAVTPTSLTLEPGAVAPMFKVKSDVLLESCRLLALTIVTLALAALGAVKLILGPVAPESVPAPLTMLQFTALLNPPIPVTMALKAVFSAAFKVVFTALAVMFVTLEEIAIGLTVIIAVSVLLGFTLLVAVIVTLVAVVTVGAMKVLMLPVIFVSVPALLVQVTPLLNAPVPFTSANTT
jgi:hypothetical protein